MNEIPGWLIDIAVDRLHERAEQVVRTGEITDPFAPVVLRKTVLIEGAKCNFVEQTVYQYKPDLDKEFLVTVKRVWEPV